MTARLGFRWSARIGIGCWWVLVKSIAYTVAGKELR